MLVAILALAIRNLSSPAVGTVTTPNPDATAAPVTSTPSYKTYSDKYVSFHYPGNFETAPVQKSKSFIDTIKLVKTDPRDVYAGIAISNRTLDTDSGVKLRKSRPQTYKIESSSPTDIVFSKNDGKEYTGFLVHGSYEISISFTSVAPTDLTQYYDTVADSLKWKL